MENRYVLLHGIAHNLYRSSIIHLSLKLVPDLSQQLEQVTRDSVKKLLTISTQIYWWFTKSQELAFAIKYQCQVYHVTYFYP